MYRRTDPQIGLRVLLDCPQEIELVPVIECVSGDRCLC
jgi:hypothetical protein